MLNNPLQVSNPLLANLAWLPKIQSTDGSTRIIESGISCESKSDN